MAKDFQAQIPIQADLHRKVSKYCTSNDADEKVQVNDRISKGSRCHRQSTHQSTEYDYTSASKAIYQ